MSVEASHTMHTHIILQSYTLQVSLGDSRSLFFGLPNRLPLETRHSILEVLAMSAQDDSEAKFLVVSENHCIFLAPGRYNHFQHHVI